MFRESRLTFDARRALSRRLAPASRHCLPSKSSLVCRGRRHLRGKASAPLLYRVLDVDDLEGARVPLAVGDGADAACYRDATI